MIIDEACKTIIDEMVKLVHSVKSIDNRLMRLEESVKNSCCYEEIPGLCGEGKIKVLKDKYKESIGIQKRIIQHFELYNRAGVSCPPFRITEPELNQLYASFTCYLGKEMTHFHGVELQKVVEVD